MKISDPKCYRYVDLEKATACQANGWVTLSPAMGQVTVTHSGYILVYIDNQSIGNDVWFDNVHLEHYTSQVLEEDMYYPFGLTLSEDAGTGVTPNNYKLTTKELQPEFGLNYYDFGARPFDMQRGQWTSMDALSESHFDITPYGYCANNPIKFMDVDGNDYVLSVNHDTKVITVQAVYYTSAGDNQAYQSATSATQFWNNESGKYQYVVGKGKDAITYSVNFDLTVKEVANPAAQVNLDLSDFTDSKDKMVSDKSSNAYSVLADDDSKFDNKNEGQITNGVTSGGNVISVKQSQSEDPQTGPHEVGHTLGLEHSTNGLMTPANNDAGRSSKITKNNVSRIIQNAIRPKSTDAGKGNLIQSGNEPINFKKGRIKVL